MKIEPEPILTTEISPNLWITTVRIVNDEGEFIDQIYPPVYFGYWKNKPPQPDSHGKMFKCVEGKPLIFTSHNQALDYVKSLPVMSSK